jgi:hypothetical protein
MRTGGCGSSRPPAGEQDQPIEKVGAELRAMMSFLNPDTVWPEEQG